ncbi:Protein EBS1 [Dissostichus eleginoides]|uniref:Protein EBS1 n=1 Tax=Dissostichus eleginoides TaxID=100907 RepID=A0AAD9FB04_DISEL|nr:Protein EBS1 [Dissostichus eleginoides]
MQPLHHACTCRVKGLLTILFISINLSKFTVLLQLSVLSRCSFSWSLSFVLCCHCSCCCCTSCRNSSLNDRSTNKKMM